jgi:hypothetical protein
MKISIRSRNQIQEEFVGIHHDGKKPVRQSFTKPHKRQSTISAECANINIHMETVKHQKSNASRISGSVGPFFPFVDFLSLKGSARNASGQVSAPDAATAWSG